MSNISDKELIQKLWKYGHFFSPYALTYGIEFADLELLAIDSPSVKAAMRSYQDLSYFNLSPLTNKYHGRVAVADGLTGPATRELFSQPRCDVPDYFSPSDMRGKTGTGSWPMPCQKEGIKVHINKNGMPSSIVEKWPTIQKQVFNAYALMGAKLVEVQSKEYAHIQVFFGSFFGGTIGLAEFNSESCQDKVTCKLSNRYVGHNAGLLKHEMGHNFNLGHTRGGTMNPSILPEIDPEAKWVPSDPSYAKLVKYFGGEPINSPNPTPPPFPPTPTPTPTPTPNPTPNPFWDLILRIQEWLRGNW